MSVYVFVMFWVDFIGDYKYFLLQVFLLLESRYLVPRRKENINCYEK